MTADGGRSRKSEGGEVRGVKFRVEFVGGGGVSDGDPFVMGRCASGYPTMDGCLSSGEYRHKEVYSGWTVDGCVSWVY